MELIFGKVHPDTLLIVRQMLLNTWHHSALTNGPALVRTDVQKRVNRILDTKHANIKTAVGDQTPFTMLDLVKIIYVNVFHIEYLLPKGLELLVNAPRILT